ncbi:hypothetical protein [Mycobacterium leprae]|uniref:hypothetical protein n=1 Tax=Mycobacterium leprae TaxID=1769 RepID=UPI0012E7227F|nr:hypothetical protein [Mycobacterium leprae]
MTSPVVLAFVPYLYRFSVLLSRLHAGLYTTRTRRRNAAFVSRQTLLHRPVYLLLAFINIFIGGLVAAAVRFSHSKRRLLLALFITALPFGFAFTVFFAHPDLLTGTALTRFAVILASAKIDRSILFSSATPTVTVAGSNISAQSDSFIVFTRYLAVYCGSRGAQFDQHPASLARCLQ